METKTLLSNLKDRLGVDRGGTGPDLGSSGYPVFVANVAYNGIQAETGPLDGVSLGGCSLSVSAGPGGAVIKSPQKATFIRVEVDGTGEPVGTVSVSACRVRTEANGQKIGYDAKLVATLPNLSLVALEAFQAHLSNNLAQYLVDWLKDPSA